jgi:hypothetical protein
VLDGVLRSTAQINAARSAGSREING